jgi:hypothetical protein
LKEIGALVARLEGKIIHRGTGQLS